MIRYLKLLLYKCLLLESLFYVAFCNSTTSSIGNNVTLTEETSITNPVIISCGTREPDQYENITWEHVNSAGAVNNLDIVTMTFNLTSPGASGIYICLRNNIPFVNISAVYLAEPKIEHVVQDIIFIDGETDKSLICSVRNSYPEVSFQWIFTKQFEEDNHFIINPNGSAIFNITSTAESSTLYFLTVTHDLQGHYECRVYNVAGSRSVEVLVRVKDRLAALWPFIGIVCEVALLIVIICAYEHRSRKVSRITAMSMDDDDDSDQPLKSRSDFDGGNKLRSRAASKNSSLTM